MNVIENIKNKLIGDKSTDKNLDEELKYHHENRDQEENLETTPPDDEKLIIPTIWVIEAYPPSFFSELEKNLKKLGWTEPKYSNADFLNVITQQRQRSTGWGSVGIGYIFPNDSERTHIPNSRTAEIPTEVEWIYVSAFQYLPSTTILTFQFRLKDNLAGSLEEPLRKNYQTYFEKNDRGHSIHSPYFQKMKNTKLHREYLRSYCSEWVSENLPGHFSTKSTDTEIPICEVLLFEKFKPFSDEEIKGFSYQDILGVHNKYFAWHSESLPGFKMYFDDIWGTEKNCMVLTGNRDQVVTEKVLQSSSDPNELTVLTSWLIEFNSTLSLWTLSKLTQSFEKSLTQYRDKFSDVNIHNANKALSELQILSQEYSSFQQNLIPFAIELSSFCEVYYDKLRKTVNFKRLSEEFMESTFFGLQKEWLDTLSKHLIKYEKESQRTFDRTNQLITTVVNNKLSKTNQKIQWGVFIMTLILLVLTFVLVIAEFENIIEAFQSLRRFLNTAT